MPAIGNAVPRRGRRSPRQDAIMQIGRKARAQSQNGPGGMLGARSLGGPSRGRVNPQGPVGRAGVAGAGGGNGGGIQLPPQLQRRVKSGAIDRTQAVQTARERQTLKAKFGADWRNKLPGGPGAFRQVQQKLRENPNNPKLMALNKRLMNRRSKLLDAAQGAGQPRPGGRVNPRGRGLLNPPGEAPAGRPRRRRVAPARPAY